MARDESQNTDRRTFLQAGAVATASALSLNAGAPAQDAPAKVAAIPTRPLGKTGVNITMLDQGAVRTQNLEGIFRLAFANGIRVFDTAKVYGSEKDFKKWFEHVPEVRKQIFLVTKDMPRTPKQMLGMLDQRLATLGTDYVDLFFIHALGDDHSLDAAINMVTGQEFKETAEAIRKSGKARFVGFSSHNKNRAPIIDAAARAGIVDAIMLQYSPWLEKDSPLNRALDACHEKGIGLITMKQIAGQFFGDRPKTNVLDEVVKRVPMLAEKKLTPFQGLLHAIWTDERISSSCVSMKNTDQIRENADAARRFEPLKTAEIQQLRDAALAHGPMLCADCDGRCSTAAGTTAELGNLTRFLTYHEHHGERAEARRQYAALSAEARDWLGADLEAARAACPNRLDFVTLLAEVERHLA
ncbi:MAG: aldo/keto reductase [Isosphaeraceae bacterium]|nr:aldo/keto reductase [Isosphaeraceae bacterium]